MPLVAEVDITLNLPFGAVDYGTLDEIIGAALREHGIPVLDVQVAGTRPFQSPTEPGMVQAETNSPFAAPQTRAPGQYG